MRDRPAGENFSLGALVWLGVIRDGQDSYCGNDLSLIPSAEKRAHCFIRPEIWCDGCRKARWIISGGVDTQVKNPGLPH